MSQIEIQDFSAFGSGIVDWSENGVQQPTDGSVHFERTYNEPIKITGVNYGESMWVEPYEGSEGKRTITFNSDEIEVDKKLYIGGLVYLNGQNIIFNNATSDFYSDGSLYLTGNSTLNISFKFSNNGVLSLSNGSNDFNGTIWETNSQNVEFGENSTIKITTASNGKTLIKATTLTGTITLDVDEDVEDGTTFSIEATNNNLIIENAEGYEVTSESVGNVTTYTVSIVSAKEVKELEVGGVVYPIKDEVARSTKQDIIDDLDSIRTNSNLGAVASSELPAVRQTANEANALAKNAQQGVSFANYQAMVNNVNAYAYDKFIIGQSIYIGTREVPDLWVYAKYEASQPYTYTTDDAIVEALKTGSLRVGRYELAALETGKVNITNVVTTDTAQTISGNKNFTGTLQKSGVAVATTTDVSTAVNNHNQDAESHSDIRADIDVLDKRIDEIQLFKFPNAIIRGEPTIQNGQISDFSVASYLQFPFLIDFQDNAFQIDFCFTTSTNVQTQQNIIDSNFGIALAISNGKGLMAISSNGTSWNIGISVGTINIQPNTTYYARLTWNKLQYKTFLSTDGQTYTQDMVLVGATRPYPRTSFIGGCNQEETGHTPHPFLGTINMNKAFLYVNNQLIWQGMDDAGLATRADISLSNLDADGEARFTAKQDKLVSGTNIKTINGTSVLGSGNLEIEGKSNLSELNDVSISSPANGQFLSYNGTNWTNTTLNALQNTATGSEALTILGTPISVVGGVNIGYGSTGLQQSVSIGQKAKVTGMYGIAIGRGTTAYSYSVAIGYAAEAKGSQCIQLGFGTNNEANTLYVGLGLVSSNNYKLLGSDGKIPEDRITKQTTLSSSSTDNQVPSAKCVYDLVGNIETLINAL